MGTVEAVADGRVRVNWQDEILEPYLDLKEAQRFRVEDEPKRQAFAFRMTPKKGDLAPDALTRDVNTGKPVALVPG